jgi:hypothetical protein
MFGFAPFDVQVANDERIDWRTERGWALNLHLEGLALAASDFDSRRSGIVRMNHVPVLHSKLGTLDGRSSRRRHAHEDVRRSREGRPHIAGGANEWRKSQEDGLSGNVRHPITNISTDIGRVQAGRTL